MSENPRFDLPPSLRGIFFDFRWENELVWRLPTSRTSCVAEELWWHLDLPVWSTDPPRPLFDLSPRAVLASPDRFPRHQRRIAVADIHRPLELFRHHDRWIVMDGYHRLARHAQLRSSSIPVRFHPDEYLPLVRINARGDTG